MLPEEELRRRAQQQAPARIFNRPRQPWDERTPTGQSVPDLLNQTQYPTPRIAVSSQPAAGIVGSLPQPTAGLSSAAPPPPTPSVPSTQQPSGILGPSVANRDSLDRNLALREILAQADPESDVRIRGDQIDEGPPGMAGVNRKGRLRRGFGAALAALGNADPDRPLYSLGQGLGGLATGLISPRSGAKIERRFEINQLDDDIARGLKLKQEEAQLGGVEALRRQRELEPVLQAEKLEQEREIQNAKLEIERQKAAGLITKQEADRQQKELDRQSRERIAEGNRASRERIAATSPSGIETRAAKAAAAQEEYEQLTRDEAEAGKQKNAAYAALEQARKDTPNSYTVDQMEKEAERLNAIYQSYAEKKRDAQRRMRENQVSSQSGATLQGAIDAFKRASGGREPNEQELANIKRYYGFQ